MSEDTWILPKQLHTLAYALDTEALSLDSSEQSRICAQSLFVRSKPLPLRTWLRKCNRDAWTQHLSGRMLRPSLGNRFEDAWISSLADTLASPSARLEGDKERTTQDISGGHTSQEEFGFFSQDSASLRTSKDISAWGCPTSSKTWQEWVIERRGAYSQRLKLAHRTSGSECSSWPTASARDGKDSPGAWMYAVTGRNREDQLARKVYAVEFGRVALEEKTDANGSHPVSSTYRLNPRWVEALMGIPVGWVMPSGRPYRITNGYVTRMTAASTNFASLATVSSPQPPS